MIDRLIDTDIIPLLLLAALGVAFLIQMVYYWGVFWRLGRTLKNKDTSDKPGVSVVICAHNEYRHLKESLPLYLEQDYPEYEVVVVNHASDDDTQFLLNTLQLQYPHLKSLTIQEDLNFFSGKKFPLSIGIKSAKYEILLLTDADCIPSSKNWVGLMQSAYSAGVEIVLGYGPYNRLSGFVNKLIRFDTVHIATQYLSFAVAGFPYMGVGRNLSYVKSLFYRNNGFISHYRLHSGDDDLFINRVATRRNTAIMTLPGSYTFSAPKLTMGKWITQKKRHLSTATHYRPVHKILLGLYSISLVLFYTGTILLLSLNISVFAVAAIFLLRLITQYLVFTRCMHKLDEKDLIPFVPVFEILLLLLNSGSMISNLFRKPVRWK